MCNVRATLPFAVDGDHDTPTLESRVRGLPTLRKSCCTLARQGRACYCTSQRIGVSRIEKAEVLVSEETEYSESGTPIYRHTSQYDSAEAPQSDPEALAALDAHYAAHLGEGWVYHEIVSHIVHLDVHIFSPTPKRNYYTLITSGMSDLPMNTPVEAEQSRYAELLMCLPATWQLSESALQDPTFDWPLHWLKTLARLPHEYDTWLGVGHTVPNGDPAVPFAPNTKLCCAMAATPVLFSDAFTELEVRPGKRIEFLSLLPLYQEEVEFKLKHGGAALFERLEAAQVTELLDIQRKNVCRKRFGFF